VLRPRLLDHLNHGLHRKLTLLSAPAGFGKTTLLSEWVEDLRSERGVEQIPRIVWLSLDDGDNDPGRFLSYILAALIQADAVDAAFGRGALSMLQSPQPPTAEAILTSLINELAAATVRVILILDDYHRCESQTIGEIVAFIVDHLPPRIHLAIATREDPNLPLARLRAKDQLTELRASDLRFASSEAAEFLNRVMRLDLSPEDIAALQSRTEGWITGLQLAALSLLGSHDPSGFVQSFTGSHRFVLDYLIEEVLDRQPESLQAFLMKTAILDRLTGSLCNALTGQDDGQQTLEQLDEANLFIVPLDSDRRWYRYHQLFAELLRQRLLMSVTSSGGDESSIAELHLRASEWYEDNDMEIEAFRHATAANDIDRAERLMLGKGMPLHFRGAVAPVLNWLESLSPSVLDARPSLWVMYASALSISGQNSRVEQKLQAAEAALSGAELDDRTRNLMGHIAAIRAMLAAGQQHVETIIAQSRRALEYLDPDNLPVRTATTWKLGYAYHLQGDRAAAGQAYAEAMSISQASGNLIIDVLATTGLGAIQEAENQLYRAAETYRRVLQLVGDPPQPAACEAYLGLARIFYEWNDLEAAQEHGQKSLQLARQIEGISTSAGCGVLLAHLRLAQGDITSAASILAEAERFVQLHDFAHLMPKVAAEKALILLRQGKLAAAAELWQKYNLPAGQARVHLARGDMSKALELLESWRQEVEAKRWGDEQLKAMVLQALARHAVGEREEATRSLGEALALAEPGGFIRTFVDEGAPMAQLLSEAVADGIVPDYVRRLLAVFETEARKSESISGLSPARALIEPLSQRELEVLRLIAQGLSNREISERLFLALDTVKGHNRKIFEKLQVQRRAEAAARARELGLL
jgi:LuxR family maltose regulon positive regulatory protein